MESIVLTATQIQTTTQMKKHFSTTYSAIRDCSRMSFGRSLQILWWSSNKSAQSLYTSVASPASFKKEFRPLQS